MKEEICFLLGDDFPWKNTITWFDTIDSTNTRAKELSARGAAHGTVLIAEEQTGGRGRLGRSFHSPKGTGIYMSVVLRPNCGPMDLMHLTCAAAVAMCDAVEKSAGFRPGIKWTNDLVYGSRKLGGILTELGLLPSGEVDYAIIGIGINCGQSISDFPEKIRDMAGSLSLVAGHPIDRAKVAAAMIEALFHMDRVLLTGKSQLMLRYRSDCITLGKQVSLMRSDGAVRHGLAVDIDNEGGLIIRFDDGITQTVSSGEVSVRGLYGYL